MSKEERNLEPKGASSGRKGEDRTGNKGSPRHGAISGQQDALGQMEGKHTQAKSDLDQGLVAGEHSWSTQNECGQRETWLGVEDRVETKEFENLFGWDSALCGGRCSDER